MHSLRTHIVEAKETYYRGKRDLLMTHTHLPIEMHSLRTPIMEAKETYYRRKKDLLMTHTVTAR